MSSPSISVSLLSLSVSLSVSPCLSLSPPLSLSSLSLSLSLSVNVVQSVLYRNHPTTYLYTIYNTGLLNGYIYYCCTLPTFAVPIANTYLLLYHYATNKFFRHIIKHFLTEQYPNHTIEATWFSSKHVAEIRQEVQGPWRSAWQLQLGWHWQFSADLYQNSLLQTKSIEIWVNSHTVPHYTCINLRSYSTP